MLCRCHVLIHATKQMAQKMLHAPAQSPRYLCCPKCGHSTLPENQLLPAACPACGLILSKFGMPVADRLPLSGQNDDVAPSRLQHLVQQLREAITYIPSRIDPAIFWSRAALLALLTGWAARLIWMDHRDGEIGSSFLHGPLLVFHEAGHFIFRPFGEFLTILGGTVGQLLMPAIMAGALLIKNRDPFGAAVGLWLFGVSMLDIAPYIYDALHPQLVLLGGHTGDGGGHDWIYLLGETGLLKRAQGLGWLVHKLGALVVLISITWAGWVLWQQKKRLADSFGDNADNDM